MFDLPLVVSDLAAAGGSTPPPTPVLDTSASLLTIPCRNRPALMAEVAALLLLGVWLGLALSGARDPDLGDLFYVPILWSAVLFGVPGGVAAGAAAALLAGPLSPADQYVGRPAEWGTAAVLYLLFGFGGGIASARLRQRECSLARLVDQLDRTYGDTLRLIAETVELRDPITAGHSQRVAHNALVVGRLLGDGQPNTLYWAGLLHDVGKVAVPESILHKPERLTPAEWEVMRAHVRIGADLIARSSPDFGQVADAVRSHHEHWDGSGYLGGLAGEQIPIHGRILAVVDVFEALTCRRPYREPVDEVSALEYVRRGCGTYFDPRVVAAFETALAEGMLLIAGVDCPPIPPPDLIGLSASSPAPDTTRRTET